MPFLVFGAAYMVACLLLPIAVFFLYGFGLALWDFLPHDWRSLLVLLSMAAMGASFL